MICKEKDKIKSTVEEIRRISFQEKRNYSEKKMNSFLNVILDFKENLNEKTDRIQKLVNILEEITWFKVIDDECLMLLNDLIAQSKDLHSSLIRHYALSLQFKQKGIAKKEIINYKTAIDDFKESFSDLESVFFFLPDMPEFKETTRELSLI
jgi:hypothetical protein